MRRSLIPLAVLIAAWMMGYSTPPAHAARSQDELRQIGAKLAAELARVCPHGSSTDTSRFQACANALSRSVDVSFAPAVLWGGDQPTLRIKNRKLTSLSAQVFRSAYLPLMSFTGQFSIGYDEKEKLDIIRVEAYFRNALSAGEYPYPFWHAADKWQAYETMNLVNFYLDDKGRITLVTRSASGSEANRGQYAHVTPPVFVKDVWTWTDPNGQAQPRVMLFASRYQAANPSLLRLDEAYRAFAETMRGASCVACHDPSNTPGASRLILLQTPLHAAAEIRRVLKSVQSGDMPQDDVGMPKEINADLRAAILRSAQAFRDELIAADAWEAERQARTARAPSDTQQPALQ